MVKINDLIEQAGAEVEEQRVWTPRNHHNWGARFGRRRAKAALNTEPRGLLELEKLTQRSVKLMEKHSPKSEQHRQVAMDLLRLQHNMNFIVVCEKCGGPHVNDEILSPER